VPSPRRLPRLSAELRERDAVRPLELFFDLVFVLVFTQCTLLMAQEKTWESLVHGLLVLALVWWAWVGYSWLTSVVDPEEGAVRFAIFGAMAALLIVALCVPHAFGDRALAFAVFYGLVRVGHIALFLIASAENEGLRRSVRGLAGSTAIGVGLVICGALLQDGGQVVLWLTAIAVDTAEPALFGVEGWQLVPGHFAERNGLMIILALGESIVALGVGAEAELTAGVYISAVLGVSLAAAIWWTYFDVVSLVTERRLAESTPGAHRNALARDSYSYLHYPMVAGIILIALGMKVTLGHHGDPLGDVSAFAMLGGTAIYLLAHVVLRLRNAHSINRQRLLLAIALLAAWPFVDDVSALATLAGLNVAIWTMIAYEFSRYDERRYRLRHGL
jgi:low temperature requirement protein LtrA